MRENFSEKKIPTLIGLLIITIGIFGTSFLVRNLGPLSTRATPSEIPQEVKITNLSNNSLTISWTTQDEVAGSVLFWNEEKNQQLAVDARDKSENAGSYKTHFINLSALTPTTPYFFTLNSGKSSYNNNDSPYKVTTNSSSPRAKIQIQGEVLNSDSSPGKNVLIYSRLGEVFSASAFTSSSGEWALFVEDNGQKSLALFLTDGQTNSTVKIDFPVTAVAPITLGQDYDFTKKVEEQTKEATLSGQKTSPKFNLDSGSKSVNAPQILNPKEGDKFIDAQPRFSGTALKGSDIKIVIQSPKTIEATVKADKNGSWSYRPQTPLTSGEHTITITAPDGNGIMRSITQSFQVFASGSQVALPSTPSASSGQGPSATPTTKVSPTPPLAGQAATPTATPTEIITPTQIPIPTKAPRPIPVTADTLPSMALGGFGVLAFILGLALLF